VGLTWYTALSAAGLALSVLAWARLAPIRAGLGGVYLGALGGALVGAKLAFLLAEGWHYRNDTLALLTGRSISGALLGGYGGVELAKHLLRRPGATGDLFALVVPLGLIVGRVGCLVQGCCPGVECDPHWWTITDAHGLPRWPAAAAEMVFNAAFLLWATAATTRR
jgi:prolipoprotein diacylglyceryltransferase